MESGNLSINPPPQTPNPAVNTLSPAVGITPQGQEAPLGQQATEAVLTEQVQKPPASQSELPKRKPARPPSSAWKHFIREKDNAICKYCKKVYRANSGTHGTSNMLKHSKKCLKNPYRNVDKKQKTLALGKEFEDDPNSVSFKLVEFNQEKTRVSLAKMIIIDELSFKFVENEGFRLFMGEAQPRFKIPSRITVARDCIQLYNIEKDKLKCILSTNKQKVSFTTDTWTSIQNMNYMCVTGHYIDEGWELRKKILHFGLITDHKGETIGINLEGCMKEWGIKNIGCVTVDNASSNNVAISYVTRGMSVWNGHTLLNGEFMHMRCAAHILNLIVHDGMKEIDPSIARIRAACKFVKASSSRLATFKKCAHVVGVPSQAMITLDCQTRWNSTYLMLEVAEKYEQAFYRLEYDDAAYMITLVSESGGCPNQSDWNRARVFLKFLKIFYDATLSFSGSLHVTANNFFKQLIDIQKALNRWRMSDDVVLQKMTANMQVKFNKYWESGMINYLLFVAVFLDPRYKFDYIEFCFSRMYDDKKCKEMMTKLKDIVNKLFEHYMVLYPVSVETSGSSTLASNISSGSNMGNQEEEEDWDGQFRLKMKKKQGEVQRNELERYLEDGVEETSPTFDILNWWKGKTNKYHVLSYMAKDILAIPVSTVSSESAFSTGGRVLDSFRSSLSPSTVEALICTQNWIKSPKVVDLEAELEEVQRIEAELLAATTDEDAIKVLNVALNTVTS